MADDHKHKKTMEEERKDIEEGESEENVYSEAGRKELMEDEDEITDADEGFMKGYDEGGKMTKCPVCNGILEDDFVEREIKGETYRFCSEEHAEKYAKQHGAQKAELEAGETEKALEKDANLEDIEKDKKVLKETE